MVIMGASGSRMKKLLLGNNEDYEDDDDGHQRTSTTTVDSFDWSLHSPLVFSRKGSMYIDEDGDIAHEFYMEAPSMNSQRTIMKRVTTNLKPQACKSINDPQYMGVALQVLFEMQPSQQNSFDPGRLTSTSTSMVDRTVQPIFTIPQSSPPPPTYQQHFQSQNTPSFGTGRDDVNSSTMFPSPSVPQHQSTNVFGSSWTNFQPQASNPIFNAASNDSLRSNFTFTTGASNTSRFRFIASRTTTPVTSTRPSFTFSNYEPKTTNNVFQKKSFSFSPSTSSSPSMSTTSAPNIFASIDPRLSFSRNASFGNTETQSPGPIISMTKTTEIERGSEILKPAIESKSNLSVDSEVDMAASGDMVNDKKPVVRRRAPEVAETSKPVQHSLAGRSRRSRLPSKDLDKRHSHETRTRRLSERSNESSGSGIISSSGRFTADEIEHLTSIVIKGVPARLNNKRFLLQHFGRYGIVQKINCMITKEIAIVYFIDHKGAKKAKESGAELEPGRCRVLILWGRKAITPTTRQPKDVASTLQTTGPSSTKTSKDRKSKITNKKEKTLKEDDENVRDELNAMVQGDDLEAPLVLNRPREVDSRSYLSPKQTKSIANRRASPQPTHNVSLQDGSDIIQGLANRQAITAGDKFQVLVARDKYLRQNLKKPADLASATAVVGTCPDMCPEKERYMREDRCQLHPYEILSVVGDIERSNELPRVDHRKAIKEYSRSSADQEEPLPHELRSPIILSLTMDYIVCNVLDMLDGPNSNVPATASEWYDFVWNRTRAIRKDITQQHLCDQTSVALVEKCTRFHIHCAERLCEEDMSVFDQKINNENLTKCLQTLKHFYADLDEVCPNEAEFRAYDILLNLNEGDTLRDVLCLKPEIRRSNEVRFALRLFANLNSNNYVAFFKSVRQAPYLMACTLQRYFTQVRERALKVTLKAYCPPNHSGQFPINKFVQMLAFEDQAEAQEFLNYHNLNVEMDYFVWGKAGLSYPESAVPTRRARTLIESKRYCSVGEIVNGGQLPPNPSDTYEPYSSFDQQGTFIVSSELTPVSNDDSRSDQTDARTIIEPLVEEIPVNVPTSKPSVIITDEQRRQSLVLQLNKAVNDIVNDIAVSVSNEMVVTVCQNTLNEIQFNMAVMSVASNLLTDVSSELIRNLAGDMLKEFKIAELRLRKHREEVELDYQCRAKEAATDDVLYNVLAEVVDEDVHQLAATVLRNERELEWQRVVQRVCEIISLEYVTQWTAQFMKDTIVEIHSLETEYRRSTLERVGMKLDRWRAVRFYRKWQNLVARRKRTRYSMETFPSCTNLGQSGQRSLAEPWVHGKLQSPLDIASGRKYNERLLDLSVYRKHLENRLKATPLDLLSLVENNTRGNARLCCNFWKVIVLIPSNCGQITTDDSYSLDVVSNWVLQKLSDQSALINVSIPETVEMDLLNLNSSVCDGHMFGVCAKAFYGRCDSKNASDNLKNQKELWGTRGILMIMQAPRMSQPETLESYWIGEYERLCMMVSCMPPDPSVPLLLLNPWSMLEDNIVHGLQLDRLVKHGLISMYSIVEIGHDIMEPASSNQLRLGMKWLISQNPESPKLKPMELNAFVDDCITKFFTAVVYRTIRTNIHNSIRVYPTPDLLVVGYNHAISFAAKIASSNTLKDISWPPKEFLGFKEPCLLYDDWNSDENLSKLSLLVHRYHLPPFTALTECATFEQLSTMIFEYIRVAFCKLDDRCIGSKVILQTRIQRIINRSIEAHGSKEEFKMLRPSDITPWIDIIQAIIDHMFCCLAEVDVTVVYDPRLAQMFTVPKEWTSSVNQSFEAVLEVIEKSKSNQQKSIAIDDGPKTKDQGMKRKLQDPFEETPRETEIHRECQRLSKQLTIEKQRNAEYEQYLNRLLKDGQILFDNVN